MRLYRTPAGLARGEGDELALLDLPHLDVADLLSDGIEQARRAPVRSKIPFQEAVLLSPVAVPGTLVIAGANYRDHVAEAGMPTPTAPPFLTVTGMNATGPNETIWLPAEAPSQVDYEAELAVVIGRPGRDIPVGRAWHHVAGLIAVNDVSARDVQLAAMTNGVVTDIDGVRRGKSFPHFKPMGPALVTVDETGTDLDLAIRTYVNGEVRQDSRTSEMIFSVPEIISHVSATTPLLPGDVVLTGTPGGVALASGGYLRSGDVVIVEIEGLGRLRNPVHMAPPVPN
ncbi:fumarylacetoacetate hydrolase family protein [Streptomyces sp. ME01-24h]|nr:fumarylacetoacetate hydrolase family protein [Streptomyces sp. ME19-03-3]MDX3355139.1 fumarylacetoacetate hydrolase family protein [Streptomyces sp. ME01-24h]